MRGRRVAVDDWLVGRSLSNALVGDGAECCHITIDRRSGPTHVQPRGASACSRNLAHDARVQVKLAGNTGDGDDATHLVHQYAGQDDSSAVVGAPHDRLDAFPPLGRVVFPLIFPPTRTCRQCSRGDQPTEPCRCQGHRLVDLVGAAHVSGDVPGTVRGRLVAGGGLSSCAALRATGAMRPPGVQVPRRQHGRCLRLLRSPRPLTHQHESSPSRSTHGGTLPGRRGHPIRHYPDRRRRWSECVNQDRPDGPPTGVVAAVRDSVGAIERTCLGRSRVNVRAATTGCGVSLPCAVGRRCRGSMLPRRGAPTSTLGRTLERTGFADCVSERRVSLTAA